MGSQWGVGATLSAVSESSDTALSALCRTKLNFISQNFYDFPAFVLDVGQHPTSSYRPRQL